MKISLEMMASGIFLMGVGGQLTLNGGNRFHIPLGIAIAVIGLGLLFFSEEQHRNPAWLNRQVKHLIWKYWPTGS